MTKEKLTSDGIILLLKDLGVRYVQCEYSGGGDSGAIDEWGFYDSEQTELVDWQAANFIDTEQKPGEIDTTTEEMKAAWSVTEDLILDILNTKVMDWWNNEGGYGSFLMDIDTCEYIVCNNQYYTTSKSETVTSKFESAE